MQNFRHMKIIDFQKNKLLFKVELRILLKRTGDNLQINDRDKGQDGDLISPLEQDRESLSSMCGPLL